jgi:hypothetical protein
MEGSLSLLKLYHVRRTDNGGYDSYSEFVAAAYSEDDARKMHPDGGEGEQSSWLWTWTHDTLSITYIGEAAPGIHRGVIVASFHAG